MTWLKAVLPTLLLFAVLGLVGYAERGRLFPPPASAEWCPADATLWWVVYTHTGEQRRIPDPKDMRTIGRDPPPMVTLRHGTLLVCKEGETPFLWALRGGFVLESERLLTGMERAAAIRVQEDARRAAETAGK